MKILRGSRQSGKTHTLVEWCKEDVENRAIITPLADDALRLKRNYGVEAYHCRESVRGVEKTFVIDELDTVLMFLLGTRIEAATFSGEVEEVTQ